MHVPNLLLYFDISINENNHHLFESDNYATETAILIILIEPTQTTNRNNHFITS